MQFLQSLFNDVYSKLVFIVFMLVKVLSATCYVKDEAW